MMMGSARNYYVKYGGPGRTRTCGTRFRKPLLCPPELQAHRLLRVVGPCYGITALVARWI